MADRLKTVVVGLNRGLQLAVSAKGSQYFHLTAICDVDGGALAKGVEKTGCANTYADYSEMLAKERPDVVVIGTHNSLHAPMTLEACGQAGVKGIYCEKPMAVSMGEARSMLDACASKGISLFVGHQRRKVAVYRTMKKVMDSGALGQVYLIRGVCSGDVLSDGSHTFDSIRFFCDDRRPEWCLGQVYRADYPASSDYKAPGYRYGHMVEDGSMAVVEFEGGMRAETFMGGMRRQGWDLPYPGWAYQDIEIIGTKGRLWRGGDLTKIPIQVFDQGGGYRELPVDPEFLPKAEPEGGDLHGAHRGDMVRIFDEFYRMVAFGEGSSLSGENVLGTLELVMAVYESARINDRVTFPLAQDKYPLELMVGGCKGR
ncbi:MAG: Gfo/Idh/MocA family oxidoreductase [Oscillospiraceae bacterium]|nr:Gfo/Idh/MocA family oxidoreductase [Oscillospiraceae bacterium]